MNNYQMVRRYGYSQLERAFNAFKSGKEECPKDTFINILSQLRDYAEELGVNWDELEFRSSLPIEDEFETLQEGKVVYWSKDSQNQFGFLNDGAFLHITGGRVITCDGSDHPVFTRGSPGAPKVGDILLYCKIDGRKGPKAEWWGFDTAYKVAEEEIKRRPIYRLFRPGSNLILWSGKDLSKFRVFYPKTFSLEGYIVEKFGFGGKWEECSDPR